MRPRLLLATALLLVGPPAPAQDRLSPARIEAMPLADIVVAVRGRCADMVTAMTELQSRHPDANGVPDCGGATATADGGSYRAMDDSALIDAIEVLSSELAALVARGEALQSGRAVAPAPTSQPVRSPRRPPARSAKPVPDETRKKQCEAQQHADAALCSDSSCRMATYRRWQQCLATGRYW